MFTDVFIQPQIYARFCRLGYTCGNLNRPTNSITHLKIPVNIPKFLHTSSDSFDHLQIRFAIRSHLHTQIES